jgi:hypothetical protein
MSRPKQMSKPKRIYSDVESAVALLDKLEQKKR